MSSAATTPTGRLMPVWGKSALLVGLFFFTCWGAAIVYWRTTDRMPGAGELAFCLVGVPLLLSGGLWLSRKVLMPPPRTPAAGAPAAPAPFATHHIQPLAILATALRLPHGSSPEEVYAAIKASKARPDLDRELRDEDGFPVMTARCAAADDEASHNEIEEWLTANGFTGHDFDPESWRALVLATQVLGELALATAELASQPLRLVPISPPHWSVTQRSASSSWLLHMLTSFGWAPDQITIAPATTAQFPIAGELQSPTMVIAFASNIGDRTIRRWENEKMLFTSANPRGLIPGESAAGLVVAGYGSTSAPRSIALLFPAEVGRRDSSADESRRADHALLKMLAEQAVAKIGLTLQDVAAVIADTDHRVSRNMELMGFASSVMPHLDDSQDLIRVGASTGACGAVSVITALVLAAHSASDYHRPIVAINNDDAYARAVTTIFSKFESRE
jgi:hypothetical protein